MAAIAQDLRYAFRLFGKAPAFTLVAIFTLSVGIGANTSIFSVANALLIRPLPFAQPERLVYVATQKKSAGSRGGPLSYPRFTFLHDHVRSFSGLAGFSSEVFNLTGRGDPEQVRSARVSWDFFDVLGVHPPLGRSFRAEEDKPGGDLVVLISHSLWTRVFAADPAAVGQHLTLDGRDYTVIGVLPSDFRFDFLGTPVDVVAPRLIELNILTPQQAMNGTGFVNGVGRLRPGVALRQAQAEIETLGGPYRSEYPKLPDADPELSILAGNLRDEMVVSFRPAVLILFGAVSLVLLIACANVASLLLSRALGRKREIAVRMAIGATRGSLVRQLLTESLVLALAGGVGGTLLSAWGTRVLAAMAQDNLPRATGIHTDVYVLGFTLGISVLAGLLFGLVPAVQISRPDLNTDLRSEGRGSTSGRRRNAVRNLLVVSQVALSLVLLIGAGLLVRNFVQLRRANPGFAVHHLLTMKISLPTARYSGGTRMTAFYDESVRQAMAVPGVSAAATSSALPANPVRVSPALPEGQPEVPLVQRPLFNIQTVSPGYVAAMGLPLLRGREFTGHDDATAPRVIIVNETLARRYWPNQNPIGKHIVLGRIVKPMEVVGVFGDLRNLGLAADVQPEIYLPFAQLPWPTMHLLVRTTGDPHAFVSAVRGQILALDRDLPVTAVESMDEVLEAAAAQPRFTTSLLGSLSGAALLLAMVGIYGVIAYSVAERTQEMGIRMALGAGRTDILRMVLRQALGLALGGIAIGVAASLLLTRLLGSLLYRVSVTDPFAFVGGSVVFAAVALLASYVPARRATRVDPVTALR